jgi:hypothetical protein
MRPDHASAKSHYGRLLVMTVLSFISMYILMYAMVDRLANVYPSFNQFYMAGLMTAPMVVIEIGLMTAMYENTRWNAIIIVLGSIVAILFFAAIRQQAAIGDTQFLKSMIPHHAGAILMCNEASISDPEIGELCKGIVSGQQSEIDKMMAILARLEQ